MDDKRLEGEIACLKLAIAETDKRLDALEMDLADIAQLQDDLADILHKMVEVITNE